ncbi:MAG: NADH-quinone oxidoreductase subunit D, partial [Acidimicrobiaceae bacterium]|nr:NADH-quinone oxidoreductase subunit D [Acidimicrobiaceae bacterium]
MTESVAADEVDETTVPDLGSAERVLKRDETSAVLRLSEAEAAELAGDPDDQPTGTADDQRMILNMGPSHPSTHGVLRLMLEMEGETVL